MGWGKRWQTGIDDFLALGYTLDQLTLEAPYAPYPGLAIASSLRLTKAQARILKHLQSDYGLRGAFFPSDVADSLKLDRRTVLRAYQRFEEANILRVWRGNRYFKDGNWQSEPHSFFMFGVANSYRDYLNRLSTPSPHARLGQPKPAPGWVQDKHSA